MTAPDPEVADLARQLRAAVGDLSFRMRRQRRVPGIGGAGFSILSRLYREGPQSQSRLAAADGVQPQSLTRPLDQLETAGLLAKLPDPHDGRKLLLTLTPAGMDALRQDAVARTRWLAAALAERTDTEDRAILRAAVQVLYRVSAPAADTHPHPDTDPNQDQDRDQDPDPDPDHERRSGTGDVPDDPGPAVG